MSVIDYYDGQLTKEKETAMSKTEWIITSVVFLSIVGACTVGGWVYWAICAIAGVP